MFGIDKTFLKAVPAAGLALCLLTLSGPALALGYYWGQHPDKDRLVFRFDSRIPSHSLERTGPQRILVRIDAPEAPLPPKEDRPGFADSRFIRQVDEQGGDLLIRTKTSSFGFVHFTLPEENKLVVDLFGDSHGSQWKGNSAAASAEGKPSRRPSPANASREKDGAAAPDADEPLAKAASQQKAEAPDPPARSQADETAAPKASEAAPLKPPLQRPKRAEAAGPRHMVRGRIFDVGPLRAAPVGSRSGQGRRESAGKPQNRTAGAPPETSQNATGKPGLKEPAIAKDPPSSVLNASANLTAGSAGGEGQNASSRPDPEALLAEGREALTEENFASSARIFSQLSVMDDVPEGVRQEALHKRAESLYRLFEGRSRDHYAEITGAFQEAINFNPQAAQVPRARYRLFLVNLKIGNLPEAKGYFNVLASEHPGHSLLPTARLQLGEYFLKRAEYDPAMEHLRAIIQGWPDSRESRQAHFGLIRAFSEMEFFAKAWEKVEAVERRWPGYHKRNPEFLNVAGFVALQTDRLQRAKQYFWRYYNLRPEAPEADFVLTRLGDIYLRQGHEGEATVMYHKAISLFPGQEGALVAKMRLAEEGIYDNPRLKNMPSYSEEGTAYYPPKVYSEIIDKHPDSPLAPLAQVKLAMWFFWKGQPERTLREVERFERTYPASGLLERARQIGRKALSILIDEAVRNQDQAEILDLWDSYDFLHASLEKVPPETQLSVATAMWKKGRIDSALKLASRFLKPDSPAGHYSTALKLSLNIHLANQSWPKIVDLAQKAESDKLSGAVLAQLRYAEALALENLDRPEDGAPLWKRLATNQHLSPQQRAFAYYFLARASLRSDDLEAVYTQAQNALSILLRHDAKENRDKILDSLDMLIQVTRRSGRRLEALQWAERYQEHISPSSQEWPAHRYRLAEMYRRAGDTAKWKEILQSLAKKHPNSRFGQMAASDLAARNIQQQADALLGR